MFTRSRADLVKKRQKQTVQSKQSSFVVRACRSLYSSVLPELVSSILTGETCKDRYLLCISPAPRLFAGYGISKNLPHIYIILVYYQSQRPSVQFHSFTTAFNRIYQSTDGVSLMLRGLNI